MKSDDPLEQAARERVRIKLRFLKFATICLLLSSGLLLLQWLHPGRHFEPLYPLAGLAIALGIHGFSTWWRLGAAGMEARWVRHERSRLARREIDPSH